MTDITPFWDELENIVDRYAEEQGVRKQEAIKVMEVGLAAYAYKLSKKVRS